MLKFLKKVGFIPEHTELSLYLVTISLLLFSFFDSKFRNDFSESFDSAENGSLIFVVTMVIGSALSIYHVFSKRGKNDLESKILYFFSATVNAFIAYSAGKYFLLKPYNFLVIFPLLNFFSAIILVLLLWIKINTRGLDTGLIADVKRGEIILGTAVVLIIFAISRFIDNNIWPITFSISTVYAMNFNEFFYKRIAPILTVTK